MDQDSPNIDYLYDFLYVDKTRMGLYFAQMFDGGVLTGSKTTQQNSETNASNFTGNAGVAKAGMSQNSLILEAIEKQFDTSWSLPLNVIEALDETGFIERKLSSVPTGKIVLIKGTIAVLDIKMMKEMWAPMKDLVVGEAKTTHKNKTELAITRSLYDSIGGVLSKLPECVQLFIKTEEEELAWTTLLPQNLTINPDDLGLKYGANIEGEWHLLGILDARPDNGVSESKMNINLDMFTGTMQLMNGIRSSFGRPNSAYGVCPIAIFRAIHKH